MMFQLRAPLRILLISLILCGCAVGNRIEGQYYLDQEKYRQGIDAFRVKLKQDSLDPAAQYYMGRYLLALNQPKEAYPYLREAVALDFKNANYQFWLGVCYSGLNQVRKERESYQRAIAFNKYHLQARLYLGHSYLEHARWEKALDAYDGVLNLKRDHAQALYNRALALNQMRRVAEEIAAWKQYLQYYPEGSWAIQAAHHLNARGDFDYRAFFIGDIRVLLKKIRFKPGSELFVENRQPSLDVIGAVMRGKQKIHLKIECHLHGNGKLAKRRAENVKSYIMTKYPEVIPRRLSASGSGKAEKITVGGKTFQLNDSMNFMTIKK